MTSAYHALPATTLATQSHYHKPPQTLHERVTLDDPAISVMTDLTRVSAITITPDVPIKEANRKMISNKVRMLLVTDTHDFVIGLITATDLLGEKPLLYMQQVGEKNLNEVLVRDIMTPQARLEVLQVVDVDKAQVGDIVATLQREGRQHALVVDIDEECMHEKIRGIFSASQLSRQLGTGITTARIAKTFAELEAALVA